MKNSVNIRNGILTALVIDATSGVAFKFGVMSKLDIISVLVGSAIGIFVLLGTAIHGRGRTEFKLSDSTQLKIFRVVFYLSIFDLVICLAAAIAMQFTGDAPKTLAMAVLPVGDFVLGTVGFWYLARATREKIAFQGVPDGGDSAAFDLRQKTLRRRANLALSLMLLFLLGTAIANHCEDVIAGANLPVASASAN